MNNLSGRDFMDMGSWLQGLLVLMAADNHLHEKQKEHIRDFARRMGFEKGFIEEAMENILGNKHIAKVPPKFNSRETAGLFLLEAAQISVCDGLLHPNERDWIKEAAATNGIGGEELKAIENILNSVPLSSAIPDSV